MAEHRKHRKLRIALCHPDLGIGGAERLAVDAALELCAQGHDVHVFTAHHDKKRCFEETIDGTFPVTVYGDFLPRHIFNRLHALCAYIRCTYVALCMILFWQTFDVIFADQVSAVIPVLKLKRESKVLFYCHFPDMLLAQHTTRLRRLYRAPLNWIEETTTGMADCVLVNSQFTAATFASTFTRLEARGLKPAVLYPAVDVHQFDAPAQNVDVTGIGGLAANGEQTQLRERADDVLGLLPADTITTKQMAQFALPGIMSHLFLSINRFEKKKNIALAISAFALLMRQQENSVPERMNVRLAVAGGYDHRLRENQEYLQDLKNLAMEEGVAQQVVFLPSCSTAQRNALLAACICVIYTPTNEHFGIVPLEAMAAHKPVVACRSGGPVESIQHGRTGYLCEPTPPSFASAMSLLLQDTEGAKTMGKQARQHVEENFSRNILEASGDIFIPIHLRVLKMLLQRYLHKP